MGLAIARSFAALGDRVVILGRRAAVLEAAAAQVRAETGTPVAWAPADLSVPADVDRAAARSAPSSATGSTCWSTTPAGRAAPGRAWTAWRRWPTRGAPPSTPTS